MNIKGIAASPGMAVSIALVYKTPSPVETDIKVNKQNIKDEFVRFKEAHKILDDFYKEKCQLLEIDGKAVQAEVLSIQHTMLNDSQFIKGIEKQISLGYKAESAVQRETDSRCAFIESIDDEYFKDRAYDVKDLGQRLICQLRGEEYHDLSNLAQEVIVVAEDIPPSVMTAMDTDKVKGIITEIGGKTSHTAILAANMQIPAVVACDTVLRKVRSGQIIFINGTKGFVEIDLDVNAIEKYEKDIEQYKQRSEILNGYRDIETLTKNGQKIQLFANIMDSKSGEKLKSVGAEGVGLYRTEFLYMEKKTPPSEDEQYAAYTSIASMLNGAPVIIRTMDIGGDKKVECLDLNREDNPFLGYRGIRICLDRPELFMVQLRACLRASSKGNVMIMFPMISELNEIIKAKEVVEEAKRSLRTEKQSFNENIKIGIMIEVPSVAILADQLIEHVDFFSIGSNDLTQYTIAADRLNTKVSHLYKQYNPAVLRLIYGAVSAAKNAGKFCGVCGEIGSDPLSIPLVLGLGVSELSINPSFILETRKIISEIDLKKAEKLVQRALLCSSADEVMQLTREFFPTLSDS